MNNASKSDEMTVVLCPEHEEIVMRHGGKLRANDLVGRACQWGAGLTTGPITQCDQRGNRVIAYDRAVSVAVIAELTKKQNQ